MISTTIENLEGRIKKAIQEEVILAPYNPDWPRMFEEEKHHLISCLPHGLVKRIEHFGSTAIPNMSAKPIIDMLVEVTSLDETKKKIVPILINQGYDYFWRPIWEKDIPPYYVWFIKRDLQGNRTHHIHMVEHDFEHWDRLLFRDYLIEYPEYAREYQTLKLHLTKNVSIDRILYTKAKTKFIVKITKMAKKHYNQV